MLAICNTFFSILLVCGPSADRDDLADEQDTTLTTMVWRSYFCPPAFPIPPSIDTIITPHCCFDDRHDLYTTSSKCGKRGNTTAPATPGEIVAIGTAPATTTTTTTTTTGTTTTTIHHCPVCSDCPPTATSTITATATTMPIPHCPDCPRCPDCPHCPHYDDYRRRDTGDGGFLGVTGEVITILLSVLFGGAGGAKLLALWQRYRVQFFTNFKCV